MPAAMTQGQTAITHGFRIRTRKILIHYRTKRKTRITFCILIHRRPRRLLRRWSTKTE